MKHTRKSAILVCVTSILTIGSAHAVESSGEESIGTKHALVIGIEKFQEKSFTPLRYCVDDAQAFYSLLVNPAYGHYPEDNVTLLRNEEATTANITDKLKYLAAHARTEDTVTIYFSSHGYQDRKGRSFWVTYDSEFDREAMSRDNATLKKEASLDNDTISALLDRIEAQRLIVFLDCCFSADTVLRSTRGVRGIVGTRETKVEDPFAGLKGKGRVIISASDGNQKSVELPRKKHGAFTYYLLEGMRGAADDNHDNVVEVLELWGYLESKIEKAASAVGTQQKPTLTITKFTHRFPLSTYPSPQPPPTTASDSVPKP